MRHKRILCKYCIEYLLKLYERNKIILKIKYDLLFINKIFIDKGPPNFFLLRVSHVGNPALGIVQKYELVKTEDLPYLENSKFSPQLIRNMAQNILSFLKANATKAGHTYWLFKGKNDDDDENEDCENT